MLAYGFGLGLARRRSTAFFVLALGSVLAPLAVFKYLDFALSVAGASPAELASGWAALTLALPIGISFYTLQALSYLMDVRAGRARAVREPLTFAAYLAFFPQILAGPIERVGRLAPQLAGLRRPRWIDVYIGAKIALWGFFCKLVISDKLAPAVSAVLGHHESASRLSLVAVIFLYSFQIYFDFYGYTNIAIGVARAFGVRLSINFNHPYLATSLQDFWRRWHITLMRWFRDYLYLPLGGSRSGCGRFVAAILVVFGLSGLWHGAAPNFLAWAGIHAALYLVGACTRDTRRRLYGRLRIDRLGILYPTGRILTTFALVSLTWLFFMLNDLRTVGTILAKVAGLGEAPETAALDPALMKPELWLFVGILAVSFALDSLGIVWQTIDRMPRGVYGLARELALVNAMVVFIVLTGDIATQEFIYFRF